MSKPHHQPVEFTDRQRWAFVVAFILGVVVTAGLVTEWPGILGLSHPQAARVVYLSPP